MAAKKPTLYPLPANSQHWTDEGKQAYQVWRRNQEAKALAPTNQPTLPGFRLPGRTVSAIPESLTMLPFIRTSELMGYDSFYISGAVHKPDATFGPAVHFTVHVFDTPYAPGVYSAEVWTPSESSERMAYVASFEANKSQVIGPVYLLPVATKSGQEYFAIRNRSERTTVLETTKDVEDVDSDTPF